LFAFIGVMVGGKLSDRWAHARRNIRMEFEYIGLLGGAPFIVLMGLADSPTWCLVGLSGFGLFRGIYDSNLFVALFDVIEPRLRSSAVGVMLCFAFTAGSTAPLLLGWAEKPLGMSAAIALLGLGFFAGGVLILTSLYTTFGRDYYEESEEEPE
jgi:MFS family permease